MEREKVIIRTVRGLRKSVYIFVPPQVRAQLCFNPGDQIVMHVEGAYLMIRKLPARELAGLLSGPHEREIP